MVLESCMGKKAPHLFGVVHLPALPGSPGFSGAMDAVLRVACEDASALESGGVDGLIVENFGDAPFYPDSVPPETVAAMAVAVREIRAHTSLPVGVNVLRNDARAALAVAAACGASFLRINVHTGATVADQGLIVGRAHETLRERDRLWSRVTTSPPLLLADVHVKHGSPLGAVDLEQAAADTFYRGGADALLVTGSGTGKEASLEQVDRIRASVPGAPILVASGVTDRNVAAVLAKADGAIVGTWLKRDGNVRAPVDPERVRRLVTAARGAATVEPRGDRR